MDDKELMLQTQNGNQEAYELLIKKYLSQAIAFAYRYVHDSYAAEDIVQESFADIYVQRFQYNQQFQFSTYLFAVIKNKAFTYLKKQKELTMSSLGDEAEEAYLDKRLIETRSPEEEYFQKIEVQAKLEAIQQLKDEERKLLYLYAVEECSYKEIAEKTGESLMQVKIKLHRARKKIKERGTRA